MDNYEKAYLAVFVGLVVAVVGWFVYMHGYQQGKDDTIDRSIAYQCRQDLAYDRSWNLPTPDPTCTP